MNKVDTKKIWIALAFWVVVQTVGGQITSTLRFSHYSIQEGLGSTNVRKTIQDSKGYIWIATQDGLYRFDGNRFISYNRLLSNKYRLSGADIRDIMISGNVLWVVSSYGGIDAIDIITGQVYYRFDQQADALFSRTLFLSIAEKEERLFIGTDRGVVILNKKDGKTSLLQLPVIQNVNVGIKVNKLILDASENLWVLTENQGIYLVDCRRLQVLNHFKTNISRFYDCDRFEGGIVAATNSGLRQYIYKDNSITEITRISDYTKAWQNKNVYSIRIDREGKIWFTSENNLVQLTPSNGRSTFIHSANMQSEKGWITSAYGIYFDNRNQIWLSCQEGLAFSPNRPSEFVSYNKSIKGELAIKHAYYLLPTSDSTTVVCATDGLYQINQNTQIINSIDQHHVYFYAFKHRNNELIASGSQGSFSEERGKLIPLAQKHPEFSRAGKLIFNSQVNFADTLLLLGTENKKGVVVWHPLTKSIEVISDSSRGRQLKDNNVNTILKEKDRYAWILSDNSISIYDIRSGTIQELTLENSHTKHTYSIFMDVCRIGKLYYVASYSNGIVVLDENRRFVKEISSKSGLSNNGVYKLLPYKDSLLFATTNNGLSVLNVQSGDIKNYYERDGLQSSVFEELSGNTGNDRIYAGGKDGFTVINPALFTKSKLEPQVLISSIEIETPEGKIDSTNLNIKEISIPSNATQTIIRLSGFNYENPTRTVFFYRIKEKQDSWVSLSRENYLQLIGLGPGKYTLQVRAAIEDGLSGPITEIILRYQPKWFQTVGFKIFVILLLLALLYLLYRYRVKQILKLEQIRQKISSDLHDDIGSTLSSVNLFTKMAMKQPENSEALSFIDQGVQSAIISVRDIIWILDKQFETIESIFDRIISFSGPLIKAAGSEYKVDIDEGLDQYELSGDEKRNVYLVLKEAVNNSVKYSGCTMIKLIAKRNANRVAISVDDNGTGLTNDATTGTIALSKKGTGNGLKNMRLRCAEINWTLEIKSETGKGTAISVSGRIRD